MPRRRPLVRVVLDDKLELTSESQLATSAAQAPVIVFTGKEVDSDEAGKLEAQNVEIVRSDCRDLLSVLQQLGSRSLESVLVEGGAGVAGAFVDAGLVNKATFFIAPKIVGGLNAPSAVGGLGGERMVDALVLEDLEIVRRGADIEVTGYPRTKDEE
jgi:diaminohydroxyphosphoribosylaminopyrimidine deaminase/5-amino-6-(5-phosphoribosylamino)uracil reductase